MTETNKKLFITFEGGEGSGKSSQAKRLHQHLKNLGTESILTREPGGSEVGEKIRELFLNYNTSSTSQLFLNMAARYEHLNTLIRPSLLENKIVICDRFIDSTACYQGICEDIDVDEIYNMHDKWIGLMPDITFLLDVDWKHAQSRVKQRGAPDRWDQQSGQEHDKIYSGFRSLAKRFPERISVIDSRRSAEEVFLQILSILEVNFNRSS
jgi:dTMP kinase